MPIHKGPASVFSAQAMLARCEKRGQTAGDFLTSPEGSQALLKEQDYLVRASGGEVPEFSFGPENAMTELLGLRIALAEGQKAPLSLQTFYAAGERVADEP
jgi:hypothetical protein